MLNINTVTYQLEEYLSKVLPPLRESAHNTKSTSDLIRQKKEPMPAGYELVSFDVKSLFTNVPLHRAMDITLRRIYDHKELDTSTTKSEMKEMLTLCTKNVHFTYNRKIFVQTDGAAMGSLLRPDIFMTELEKTLLPDIYIRYIKFLRRYVDDTIFYVNKRGAWKRSTLRTLVQRAYLVCSIETYLKEELTHLEKVFIEKNK